MQLLSRPLLPLRKFGSPRVSTVKQQERKYQESRLEGCGNEKFISPNCHSLAIHMSGKWSWKDLNVDVQVAHTNDKMGPLTTATTVTRPPYMCARGLQLIHMSIYVACVVHKTLLGSYITVLSHIRQCKPRKHVQFF